MLKYQSIRELTEAAEAEHLKISELVLKEQAEAMEQPVEELYERMKESFAVMREAVRFGQKKDQRSMSGLTGGEGFAMKDYAERTNGGLCGSFMSRAISRALAVAGCNASMGRIVAAPTAGASGILPAVLIQYGDAHDLGEEQLIAGLCNAGAIGMIIARNASIAGASGGCQAETGSAAAMAASALTELRGGTPEMCLHAAAIALKNVMGLVCDPVAGLVECPCIKRNAIGAANAVLCSDMVMAGIESIIPFDEVVIAMRNVGRMMHPDLRETARGGIAATPTAQRIAEKIRNFE